MNQDRCWRCKCEIEKDCGMGVCELCYFIMYAHKKYNRLGMKN